MLYLIEDRDYLKIGYSANIEERMKQYKTCNCYAKLISTKPGTHKDETKLHKLCNNWLYEREWFYNVPEVKEMFENYESITLEDAVKFKKYITMRFLKIQKDGQLSKLNQLDLEMIAFMKSMRNMHYYPYNLFKWVEFYNHQEKYNKLQYYIQENMLSVGTHKFEFVLFWNSHVQIEVTIEKIE